MFKGSSVPAHGRATKLHSHSTRHWQGLHDKLATPTSSVAISSPGPNAGVGNVSAASLRIAVVLKQALKLKLCHARSGGTHHLLVGKTADLIGIADHGYLKLCLDHTTDGGEGGRFSIWGVTLHSTCCTLPHSTLLHSTLALTIQQSRDKGWNC